MNKLLLCSLLGAVVLSSAFRTAGGQAARPQPLTKPAQSLAFIENKGQWDARAQFMTQTGGLNLWVTDEGLVYDFNKLVPDARTRTGGTRVGQVVRVSFVGGEAAASSGVQPLSGKLNYFHGKEPSCWVADVRRFGEVRSDHIYSGISARYYWDRGAPRYDLLVQPGADPGQIAMQIKGADGVRTLPNGDIELQTQLGTIQEKGLTVYQVNGSLRQPIQANMFVDGDTLRFRLGSYDRSRPLVIDPILFSSYFGGGDFDIARGIAIDGSGNPVIIGETWSSNLPTTTGAYDQQYTGTTDAFVTKFSADGSKLIYSSYLGGTQAGGANGFTIALDQSGNAFVAGYTFSADFPTTAGAFQRVFSGVNQGFVTELSADGSKLVFSTLLGGSTKNSVACLKLDSAGNPVVTGLTMSPNFPITAGAFQPTYAGGDPNVFHDGDAFVSRLSKDGTKLLFSTFLGGSLGDEPIALTLDKQDRVYVTGLTWSSDFPVTSGSFRTKLAGNRDVFVSCLSADLSTLVASTFFGGAGNDEGYAIVMDNSGDVVVGGRTSSRDFPVSPGAFQSKFAGGAYDCFISKFGPDLKSVVSSTYLGSSADPADTGNFYEMEEVFALAVDADNNVVFGGAAGSGDFPTTKGADQTAYGGSIADGVWGKVSPDGTKLLFSSYLGGSGWDLIRGLVLDSSGNAVVTGDSNSYNFPVTVGAFRTYESGSDDAFVGRLSFVLGMAISDFHAEAPSIVGGYSFYADVTLATAAPTGGEKVTVTSDTPSVNGTSVVIPEGSYSARFLLGTNPVSASTPTRLTASITGSRAQTSVTVVPSALSSLTFNPSSAVGGYQVLGTVTLNGPAGPSGTTVNMLSNCAEVIVPQSVVVQSGADSAQFNVQTLAVQQSETARLSATCNGTTISQTLTLVPLAIGSLSFDYQAVGGYSLYATIGLKAPAPPGGAVVNVQSDNAAAIVPATVNVPAGARSARFIISTWPVSSVQSAHITASINNTSRTGTLKILPPTLLSIGITPTSVRGGTSAYCRIYINGPAPASGFAISLSSNSEAATVPATVTIPAGQRWVLFTIATTAVETQQVSHVTATANGQTLASQLLITP